MKKIYVKIDGITCDHCKEKITNSLMKIKNIKKISFTGHIAEIDYVNSIDQDDIIEKVIAVEYFTMAEMISHNKSDLKRNISLKEIISIAGILIVIAILINKIFGFNIFNIIPTIDSSTSYAMLFITGILTSIHCITMCGAINLVASNTVTRNFKNPLLYNLGRLISYTILGGVVGLLGSVFQLNIYVQGTIVILASIFMFLMAFNMMGIIHIRFKFKLPFNTKKIKSKSPFIIGLLNGLMPCGPLQAMQLYALSSGSFLYGALSMFLFCLGTIPLMLFVGVVSNLLKGNYKKVFSKISMVLILILSITMLNRGFLQMGFDVSSIFQSNYDNYLKAEIKDGYQYIEFDLSYSGYKDILIQKEIPVKLVINVSKNKLTGCNNSIIVNQFNIKKDLTIGKNIIEFTPEKTGTFPYTCWMSMLKNNIVVIDDLALLKGDN